MRRLPDHHRGPQLYLLSHRLRSQHRPAAIRHLACPDNSAAAIRRVAFTYYGSGDSGGSPGDLQTVAVQLLEGTAWETLSTEYYRYYTANYNGTSSTPPGYIHGLKFVVGPEAYARLAGGQPVRRQPDSVVARYADVYYEYTQLADGQGGRRVTKAVTGAGTHTHTFTYTLAPSGWTPGYNIWYLQSTGNRDDGSQKIVFTNFVRQPMLTDLWNTPGNQRRGGGSTTRLTTRPATACRRATVRRRSTWRRARSTIRVRPACRWR